MARTDDQGRPEPPLAADEASTLTGYLDFQRATLEWKCSGLDEQALRTSLPPTTMTLAGIVKHMALVEDHWFGHWLRGDEYDELWRGVDWEKDPDWEWRTANSESRDELFTLWHDAVERSRRHTSEVLADGGLRELARRQNDNGEAPSLRWILCHMIEEYARHNGHADLLRESIDGSTGE